jgi:hypothetical protein
MEMSSLFNQLSYVAQSLLSVAFVGAWMWTGDTHWWRWAVIAGVWAAADSHHAPSRKDD